MLRSSLLCSVEGVLCERAVCLCFRACDRLSFSSAVSVLECAVWCGRRLYMFSCMQCTWVFVCTHSATHVRVFAQGALAVASAAQHWSPSCHSLYWWTQSVLSDPWAAAALRREQTHPCLGQRCSSGPWSKFSFVERLHFIWLNIQMCYKKWEKKQSVLYVVWCWAPMYLQNSSNNKSTRFSSITAVDSTVEAEMFGHRGGLCYSVSKH